MREATLGSTGRIVIPKGVRTRLGLAAGTVLEVDDAFAARACRKVGAERPVTLNRRDFLRVWPEGSAAVVEP